jgi:hypothetical protein
MKSPFPGMDPYLESFWGDVHTSLVTYARDQLRGQMPPDLKVRVEEHVSVQTENGSRSVYVPDVHVRENPTGAGQASGAGATAVAEPLIVPREVEPTVERALHIIDTRSGNRVVTAIEFLSPANKVGEEGRGAYRAKQHDYLAGGVNLVEIDLLRQGAYVIAVPEVNLPPAFRRPFRICVVRAAAPTNAEVYKAPWESPLPTIRIPLRPSDQDASLNLQSLIEIAYENGDYADMDYRLEADPPLHGPEAEWADGLLREKGRR